MTHPNDMTAWDEIGCQRGHKRHATRAERVELGGEHGYHDYPPVPERLATSFSMEVFDPARYPVDGGPYCPAHDAVSATIASLGIWEPCETILALQVCQGALANQRMVDFGAQLGWYSLLAASAGVRVVAFDADAENLLVLQRSAGLNGWQDRIETVHTRLRADTPALPSGIPIRFAKIDVEGAEAEAVRVLWSGIEAGLVHHMLIEVSPCFGPGYPELVERIIGAGYHAFRLPPKNTPPISLDAPFEQALHDGYLNELEPWERSELVASWHQENLWFRRVGANW